MKAKQSILDLDKFITKLHLATKQKCQNKSTSTHAPKSAKELIKDYYEIPEFKNWVDKVHSEAILLSIEKEKARILKYANKFIKKIFVKLDKKPHGGEGIMHYAGYFQTNEWYFTTFHEWVNMYNVAYIEKEDSDFALNQVIGVVFKERDKRLNLPKELY